MLTSTYCPKNLSNSKFSDANNDKSTQKPSRKMAYKSYLP